MPVGPKTILRADNPDEPAEHEAFNLTATSRVMFRYPVILYGWAMTNPDGANPASIDVIDGANTAGEILATVDIAPSGSTREWPTGNGVGMRVGTVLNVTLGQVKGQLFYGPAHLVKTIGTV